MFGYNPKSSRCNLNLPRSWCYIGIGPVELEVLGTWAELSYIVIGLNSWAMDNIKQNGHVEICIGLLAKDAH